MGVGQHGVRCQGGEQAVGLGDEGVEGVVVVELQFVGIYLHHPLAYVEAAVGVGACGNVVSGAVAVEGLDDVQVADVVQVNGFGHPEVVAFHGVGAVGGHIHGAHEAKVAFAGRHKGELDAALAVDFDGVGDIVVVEGGGKEGREGADKADGHEVYLVGVDVDGGEERVEVVVEALLREVGIDAVGPVGGGEGAQAAVVVVLGLHALVDGEVEDFGIVELGAVDVFLYKGKMFPEQMLFEIGVELVEAHVQFLEHTAAEVFVGHDVVFLLAVDDVTHQIDGGVVAAAVAFAIAFLGGDVHRLQSLHFRLHAHLEAARRMAFERDRLGAVAHHAEVQQGIDSCDTEIEMPVDVRHRAAFGVGDGNLHKGQRLARGAVNHSAGNGGFPLPPDRRHQRNDKQQQSPTTAKGWCQVLACCV